MSPTDLEPVEPSGLFASLIATLARTAQYEVVPRWRLPRLAHARKLRRLFKHLNIAAVIDVGANEGQFHDFLRREVGFSGPVHSFEPMRAPAERMAARQAKDPNWHIHAVALGAAPATREINVTASSTFSSLLEPSHTAVPEFTAANTVLRRERITVETLDEALARRMPTLDPARSFLKLDTQGFDLEVVKGGQSVVSQVPMIQTEVSLRPIYRDMPDLQQSLATFTALGFAVADFFIVSSDRHERAVEFDCLLVRS